MQIVIDVGNTNISCGLFEKGINKRKLITTFKIGTQKNIATDELALIFKNILMQKNIATQKITSGIYVSVVPEVNHNITKMMNNYFHFEIPILHKDMLSSITTNYNHYTLGLDRLVNLKAAESLYGNPCVVVDLGTATTIDVLSQKSEFLGGMIIPGLRVALESLITKASNLSMVELQYPQKLLGTNTRECLQNGIYYLNALGISGIIKEIKRQFFTDDDNVKVVFSGGLARYMTRLFAKDVILEPLLSLYGLKIILDELKLNGNE